MLELDQELPATHSREDIPVGVRGTSKTIKRMIGLIQLGLRQDYFRWNPDDESSLMADILAGCEQKDYFCYAKSIHDYVTNDIKYVYDPTQVELVRDPYTITKSGVADCDCKCVLECSLWGNIGLESRLVTVMETPQSDEYTHVYCEVNIPGKGWTASDSTMPDKPFGWSPPITMPRKYWPVDGSAPSMSGLGCNGCPVCDAKPMSGLLGEYGLGCGCGAPLAGHRHKRGGGGVTRTGRHIAGLGGFWDWLFGESTDFQQARVSAPAYVSPEPSIFNPGSDVDFNATGGHYQMNGMSGWLDDTISAITGGVSTVAGRLTPDLKQKFSNIMDGTTYNDLHTRKINNLNEMAQINNLLASETDPSRRDVLLKAQSSNYAERQSIQEAISNYSQVAGYIQTAMRSMGATSGWPQQLAGLGVIGVDDIIYAVIAIIGITLLIQLLNAISGAMSAATGHAVDTKGYLEQLSDVVSASGNAIEATGDTSLKLGGIALVGIAAYFLIMHGKKKGLI